METLNVNSKIITGKTPSTSNLSLWQDEIDFVTPTDISGKYQTKVDRRVTNTPAIQSILLEPGSIAYTCIASIGKMSIITKKSITNQQINSLVVTNNDSEFIYYNLLKNESKIRSMAGDFGMAMINKTDFSNIPIILPTPIEQSKISNLLSKLDILINEKEKEINNINIIRNYQLKEKFHSNLGGSKMQDIMILKNGRDYKHCSTGNIPVYGTGGLMTKIDQSLSNVDAIGIGRKGTIDNPFILRAPFWTVDTLFYAIPKDVSLYYLYLQFQSINWKLYNEGSTLPSLTSKSINNVRIYIHTKNEIIHISNLFENFDKLLLNSNYELKYYYKIKKFLLKKMLV